MGTFIAQRRIWLATSTPQDRKDAIAWVMSNARTKGSFLKLCDAAGVNPEEIRLNVHA